MSICHWMCEGIGVRVYDIYQYLNLGRCLTEIKALFPNDPKIQRIDPESFDENKFDDLTSGDRFVCVGDFLSQLDNNRVLSYGDNGVGESYCYYPPKYPWHLTDSDPKSLKEARELVKTVVRKVCDVDEETLEELIDDDIYEYGCT